MNNKTIPIDWQTYFMSLAKISSLRSKDPNTKVGAVIVNDRNRIIGLGYNGMPQGNDNLPWARDMKNFADNKYPYVIHAEMNAILNSKANIEGTSIYTTLFPCFNCAKMIAQAGITKVYYDSNMYLDTEEGQVAFKILNDSNVKIEQLEHFEVEIRK
ncbi:dCMP deaminase [Mycoplasma testudineum]|uniref:dCMP deaminase n=1 Tax=Mycoplasma testudineum TaxID=244584 RepID=A0A4R6IDX3_9MOLU|nr:dCMP deaminase family protein [Mycoplasma testudineum]OYD26721.1 cytidine deaminase [Mycoplasma testudineum]TDO19778.1 dCMP deaminase [Mycoplasma testudineum]